MIQLEPIGVVGSPRREMEDDNWGEVVSAIEIFEQPGEESLAGIDDFSHVEVIFFFHLVEEHRIVTGARHPRNNPRWPKTGILAQRARNRPNRLGLTVARIRRREGSVLYVEGLDAIDGTPVLDIKPVMREFLPQGEIRQPEWATELMKDYWKPAPDG